MSNIVFTPDGFEDYTYWQTEDKRTLKKINKLINDIVRNGNAGIGKPEPLIGDLSGRTKFAPTKHSHHCAGFCF